MSKDSIHWFDPDPQPAWPNTWDASDAFSDDIYDGETGEPVEHHRVRVRFSIIDAPSRCILRWNIFNVLFGQDFVFVYSNSIQYLQVEPGSSTLGPFEIASPGHSGGFGSDPFIWYNYPSGGTGACCIDGTFCALFFTTTDCTNRGGSFAGDCAESCPGCGFSPAP